MKISTFNVRVDTPVDWLKGRSWWFNRLKKVISNIKYTNPDILSVQEVKHWFQLWSLKLNLFRKYKSVSFGRASNNGWFGERLAIFWDKRKYKLLYNNFQFFSLTPNLSSYGWDAKYKKGMLYALLYDTINDKYIIVINAHFDSVGVKARQESAKMLSTWVSELKIQYEKYYHTNPEIYLMGDFNLNYLTPEYEMLTTAIKDSYKSAEEIVEISENTYTHFEMGYVSKDRVDMIFTDKKVKTYINDFDNEASDHNMVTIETYE